MIRASMATMLASKLVSRGISALTPFSNQLRNSSVARRHNQVGSLSVLRQFGQASGADRDELKLDQLRYDLGRDAVRFTFL